MPKSRFRFVSTRNASVKVFIILMITKENVLNTKPLMTRK